MAVINPDVDSLLKKAEKNTKYQCSNPDLMISTPKMKRKKEEMLPKLLFMPMDSKSMMESFTITQIQRTKSS